MLVKSPQIEEERRNKTFTNLFGIPSNPKNKFEVNANEVRSDRKKDLIKQTRQSKMSSKNIIKEDVKMENLKLEEPRRGNNIC